MHSYCFLIFKTDYLNITSKLTANHAYIYEKQYPAETSKYTLFVLISSSPNSFQSPLQVKQHTTTFVFY